jgi:hypothetical protein
VPAQVAAAGERADNIWTICELPETALEHHVKTLASSADYKA